MQNMSKKTIVYNKLIRDRIPEIIKENGGECDVRTLNDSDYDVALRQKLQEEVDEFLIASDDEIIHELADIMEILYALAHVKGFSNEQLDMARIAKKDKRGGFDKQLFLSSATD